MKDMKKIYVSPQIRLIDDVSTLLAGGSGDNNQPVSVPFKYNYYQKQLLYESNEVAPVFEIEDVSNWDEINDETSR